VTPSEVAAIGGRRELFVGCTGDRIRPDGTVMEPPIKPVADPSETAFAFMRRLTRYEAYWQYSGPFPGIARYAFHEHWRYLDDSPTSFHTEPGRLLRTVAELDAENAMERFLAGREG